VVESRTTMKTDDNRPPPHGRPLRHKLHPGNVAIEPNVPDTDTHNTTLTPFGAEAHASQDRAPRPGRVSSHSTPDCSGSGRPKEPTFQTNLGLATSGFKQSRLPMRKTIKVASRW
jgi:hypothetical protein